MEVPISTTLTVPIGELYTKAQYNKAAATSNPKSGPFYYIVFKKELSVYLKALKGEALTYVEPNYQLTPLHVATMMRAYSTIEHILKEISNPAPKDKLGRTPLFYACALHDTSSMKMLQTAMKVEVTENIYQVFPTWKSILEPEFSEENQEFNKLTGAQYYNGIIAKDPQILLNYFVSTLKTTSSFMNTFASYFESHWPIEEGLLTIRKTERSGYTCIAEKDLPEGIPCGFYGGHLKDPFQPCKQEDDAYTMLEVEAKDVRNHSPMINDSFPNAQVSTREEEGIIYYLIVPIRPIKKGEELFIDYKWRSSVKRGLHIEFNLDEMANYFSTDSFFKDFGLNTYGEHPAIPRKLRLLGGQERLFYLFNTPSALIRLSLKELIDLDRIVAILGQLEDAASPQADPTFFTQAKYVKELIGSLKLIQEIDEQTVKKSVQDYFCSILDKYPVIIVVALLNKKGKSPFDFLEFDQLNLALDCYHFFQPLVAKGSKINLEDEELKLKCIEALKKIEKQDLRLELFKDVGKAICSTIEDPTQSEVDLLRSFTSDLQFGSGL